MTKQNKLLGIFLSISGYTAWVAGDTFVKLSGQTLPIVEILSIGFFVGLIFTALISGLHGSVAQLSTRRPVFHLMRSVLIMGATYGSIAGVIYLSLADFYTIIFTSPLILTILGHFFLNEKADGKIWIATIIGFSGVLIAIRFSGIGQSQLSWIGLATTCLASLSLALTMLTIRSAKNENSYALGFWPQVVNCLVSLAVMTITNKIMYDPQGVAFAVISGLFGGIGLLLTNASLKVAPVAVVSPYHYTQIIFGAVAGYFVFGNIPAWSVIVGAVIITLSGLYILLATKRSAKLDLRA